MWLFSEMFVIMLFWNHKIYEIIFKSILESIEKGGALLLEVLL